MQLIEANGKTYHIQLVIRKTSVTDEEFLLKMKRDLFIEYLVKNDEFYFLCNEITDAVYEDCKEDINGSMVIT